MRDVAESLAATTSRTVPNFTDHTIRHMDALWRLAEKILTHEEINKLTSAETFLLGCGFYLHDIGMAYTATQAGLDEIKSSRPYKSFMAAALKQGEPLDITRNEAEAVSYAVRILHAHAANELAKNPIPGTDRHLFERKTFRDEWAHWCGKTAESHHWSISKLESEFQNPLYPMPGQRQADLFFVSCCLRLIDYAHLNRDRALPLDKDFRPALTGESEIHWLAQMSISGPLRESNELIFNADQDINEVDPWWLFYGMLKGLDAEIKAVFRSLSKRNFDCKKISLTGVRGAASPEEMAKFIRPAGFMPIEINFQAGSMERLVNLLAGETLYGPNPAAAIRELVQNARDAVTLAKHTARSEVEKITAKLPIKIALENNEGQSTLKIQDHGIGMTQRVLTDYLLTIASNYWNDQFSIDFPEAAEQGFNHAGKFGIGFLSVFMLGYEILVETHRSGNDAYKLTIKGVGRRGEIGIIETNPDIGTTVKVKLKDDVSSKLGALDELISAYAPLLSHDIKVETDDGEKIFEEGWLLNLNIEEFINWIEVAINVITTHRNDFRKPPFTGISGILRTKLPKWKIIPEFVQGNTRLFASFTGVSVLCFRGLSVQLVSTPGFSGVIEPDNIELEASRNRAINFNAKEVLENARRETTNLIISNLNGLCQDDIALNKLNFVSKCVTYYGKEVLLQSKFPWVSKLTFPGNSNLVNTSELLNSIKSSNSIFIFYDFGPWSALRKWEECQRGENEIALLLDGEGGDRLDYVSSESPKIGTISELWPQWRESKLFDMLLELIANEWEMEAKVFYDKSKFHHIEHKIFGRIIKDDIQD